MWEGGLFKLKTLLFYKYENELLLVSLTWR